jgi:hypothetical protein
MCASINPLSPPSPPPPNGYTALRGLQVGMTQMTLKDRWERLLRGAEASSGSPAPPRRPRTLLLPAEAELLSAFAPPEQPPAAAVDGEGVGLQTSAVVSRFFRKRVVGIRMSIGRRACSASERCCVRRQAVYIAKPSGGSMGEGICLLQGGLGVRHW